MAHLLTFSPCTAVSSQSRKVHARTICQAFCMGCRELSAATFSAASFVKTKSFSRLGEHEVPSTYIALPARARAVSRLPFLCVCSTQTSLAFSYPKRGCLDSSSCLAPRPALFISAPAVVWIENASSCLWCRPQYIARRVATPLALSLSRRPIHIPLSGFPFDPPSPQRNRQNGKLCTGRTRRCSSSPASRLGPGTTRRTSPGAERWRRTSPAYARSTTTLCTERWGRD